ncbi:MAG: hypothetical protein DYG88_06555 [Chloroflexi bacterium CFX4]|nr:hypothetical protein [Chloroflexi bacterium CFX4]
MGDALCVCVVQCRTELCAERDQRRCTNALFEAQRWQQVAGGVVATLRRFAAIAEGVNMRMSQAACQAQPCQETFRSGAIRKG